MVFGGYKDWTSAPEDADLPSFCPIPPFLFASVLLVLQSLFWVRYFESQKNIFFFRFLPPSIFSPCCALCCLFCVSGRVGNNNLIDVYVSVLRQVGDDVNFSRAHQ